MNSDAPVSVDYAVFERLMDEQCAISAVEFPPGDVLLPESLLSIGALLVEAARVDENDDALNHYTRFVDEFRSEKAEKVAWFGFWSDSAAMYLYRMSDGRCCICWLGENDGLVGIALLRDERVWPLFFEEIVASCGDCVHLNGWGSLPMELSVTVPGDTLLRATFRFLTYGDGADWDYYARLGRAGEMPVVLPGSMPAWVREQDKAYWDEAYAFVRDTIGFAWDSER